MKKSTRSLPGSQPGSPYALRLTKLSKEKKHFEREGVLSPKGKKKKKRSVDAQTGTMRLASNSPMLAPLRRSSGTIGYVAGRSFDAVSKRRASGGSPSLSRRTSKLKHRKSLTKMASFEDVNLASVMSPAATTQLQEHFLALEGRAPGAKIAEDAVLLGDLLDAVFLGQLVPDVVLQRFSRVYHSWATPQELTEELQFRYECLTLPEDQNAFRDTVLKWLELDRMVLMEDQYRAALNSLLAAIDTDPPEMASRASALRNELKKRYKKTALTYPLLAPAEHGSSIADTFVMMPKEIAWELAILMHELFVVVPLYEFAAYCRFFGEKTSEKDRLQSMGAACAACPHVLSMLQFSMSLKRWVVGSLAGATDKEQGLIFWIEVMQECNSLQNFEALTCIHLALQTVLGPECPIAGWWPKNFSAQCRQWWHKVSNQAQAHPWTFSRYMEKLKTRGGSSVFPPLSIIFQVLDYGVEVDSELSERLVPSDTLFRSLDAVRTLQVNLWSSRGDREHNPNVYAFLLDLPLYPLTYIHHLALSTRGYEPIETVSEKGLRRLLLGRRESPTSSPQGSRLMTPTKKRGNHSEEEEESFISVVEEQSRDGRNGSRGSFLERPPPYLLESFTQATEDSWRFYTDSSRDQVQMERGFAARINYYAKLLPNIASRDIENMASPRMRELVHTDWQEGDDIAFTLTNGTLRVNWVDGQETLTRLLIGVTPLGFHIDVVDQVLVAQRVIFADSTTLLANLLSKYPRNIDASNRWEYLRPDELAELHSARSVRKNILEVVRRWIMLEKEWVSSLTKNKRFIKTWANFYSELQAEKGKSVAMEEFVCASNVNWVLTSANLPHPRQFKVLEQAERVRWLEETFVQSGYAKRFAQMLTVLDQSVFKCLSTGDMLSLTQIWDWNESEQSWRNWMAKRFAMVSGWTSTVIVMEAELERRALYIATFIRLAYELFRLGNINSAHAVLHGLTCTAVQRLEETWKVVKSRYSKMRKELLFMKEIFQPRVRNAQNRLNTMQRANLDYVRVPYFGLLTKDLVLIHRYHDTFIPSMQSGAHLAGPAPVVPEIPESESDSSSFIDIDPERTPREGHLKRSALPDEQVEALKDLRHSLSVQRSNSMVAAPAGSKLANLFNGAPGANVASKFKLSANEASALASKVATSDTASSASSVSPGSSSTPSSSSASSRQEQRGKNNKTRSRGRIKYKTLSRLPKRAPPPPTPKGTASSDSNSNSTFKAKAPARAVPTVPHLALSQAHDGQQVMLKPPTPKKAKSKPGRRPVPAHVAGSAEAGAAPRPRPLSGVKTPSFLNLWNPNASPSDIAPVSASSKNKAVCSNCSKPIAVAVEQCSNCGVLRNVSKGKEEAEEATAKAASRKASRKGSRGRLVACRHCGKGNPASVEECEHCYLPLEAEDESSLDDDDEGTSEEALKRPAARTSTMEPAAPVFMDDPFGSDSSSSSASSDDSSEEIKPRPVRRKSTAKKRLVMRGDGEGTSDSDRDSSQNGAPHLDNGLMTLETCAEDMVLNFDKLYMLREVVKVFRQFQRNMQFGASETLIDPIDNFPVVSEEALLRASMRTEHGEEVVKNPLLGRENSVRIAVHGPETHRENPLFTPRDE